MEFDYPGPDGRLLRSQAYAPTSPGGIRMQLAGRGAPVAVYVDPTNPSDTLLAPGAASAPTLVAIILYGMGGTALLMCVPLAVMAWVSTT